MGNCLVLEKNDGLIMKTDSQMLQHTCNEVPVAEQMQPNHLHSLLLLPQPEEAREKEKEKEKKKGVRFSEKGAFGGGGVVRIKVVMSKKELQEMVSQGEVSVDGKLQLNQEIRDKAAAEYRSRKDDGGVINCKGTPLESIPEFQREILEHA